MPENILFGSYNSLVSFKIQETSHKLDSIPNYDASVTWNCPDVADLIFLNRANVIFMRMCHLCELVNMFFFFSLCVDDVQRTISATANDELFDFNDTHDTDRRIETETLFMINYFLFFFFQLWFLLDSSVDIKNFIVLVFLILIFVQTSMHGDIFVFIRFDKNLIFLALQWGSFWFILNAQPTAVCLFYLQFPFELFILLLFIIKGEFLVKNL